MESISVEKLTISIPKENVYKTEPVSVSKPIYIPEPVPEPKPVTLKKKKSKNPFKTIGNSIYSSFKNIFR
jgi:hypothetical protein